MAGLFKGSIEDAANLMVAGLQQEIKAALIKRLHEVIREEFDQIATEVSKSVVKSVVEVYRDPMSMTTQVHVHITKKEIL